MPGRFLALQRKKLHLSRLRYPRPRPFKVPLSAFLFFGQVTPCANHELLSQT
jgi:hypothetical protein